MPFGYNGRILHVDLTRNQWEVETPNEKWFRRYVGGSSLAAFYLLKMLKPGTEPLSAENVLVFTGSVLTGAPLSGFNRFTVAARSPLTGAYGEAEAGGYWGPELKFAGFDAIVIRGKAQHPVYLWVHDGDVDIRDARNLWGRDNWETQQKIRADTGDKKVRVAAIGPAGENLVRFANIQNELEHFNGRTGLGAVMGAKNLKAVAVRGHEKLSFADPEKVKAISRWHNRRLKSHPPNVSLSKFGTAALVKILNNAGILPTRNFRDGVFNGAHKIDADAYHRSIFHSKGTCYACSVRCKRRVSLEDEKFPLDPRFGGPEYETLATLGSLLEIDHLPAVARGNQLCNLMGLDTISTGGAIAFAMECFEEGILTRDDTDGKTIGFGDVDGMLWLIEAIAHRRGLGKILSEGVKRAAEKIGRGAEKYAFHIKGSEMPAHDGRGKTGMAMGYAVSATGGDHIETPHDTNFADSPAKLSALGILNSVDPMATDLDKVRFFSLGQKAWGINNCYGICNFCSVPVHAMTFDRLVAVVRAITGWDTSLFDMMRVSERSNVMARMFNVREGFGSDEDRVIRRWHEKMPAGPLKGHRIDPAAFQKQIALYYELSGWDKNGTPTLGKLVDLNLEWLLTLPGMEKHRNAESSGLDA